MNTLKQDKEQEVREYAIDKLENLKGFETYGCDLHHEIFNVDYYIIGIYEAKQWLGDDVFEAIEVIKEYEQNTFGQVTTDLSEPERVVNMFVYIIGEEILSESKTLQKRWNEFIKVKDYNKIINELKQG
jgi:hypothetical protein